MGDVRRTPVTPLLEIGGGADTVAGAVGRIRAGLVANVADEDTAREVLHQLGLDDEVIEDRLHFARTGRTLVSG